MDLEMTGLDPVNNVIVEIATIITDDDLQIIAEGPDLVIHTDEEQLKKMDKVVVEMHTKSGLLDEIAKSQLSISQAQDETMKFLKKHIDKPKTVPLCGNSIGTDRRFLSMQMPEIEEFLHYRSIDVSTLKELIKRWDADAFKNIPKKDSSHRALDDIKESIEELKYYKETLFETKNK